MFLEIPINRATSEIDTPSDRCNRRISAQSSTLNTRFLLGSIQPRLSGKLVNFQLPRSGQYWAAVDTTVLKANQYACNGFQAQMISSGLTEALEKFKTNTSATGVFLTPTSAYQQVAVASDADRKVQTTINSVNTAVAKLDKAGMNIKYPDVQSLVTSNDAANVACASFFTPMPITFKFTCSTTATNSYSSYQAAWVAQSQSCDARQASGTQHSDQQVNALSTAYGAGYSADSLKTLYSLCAEINGYISNPKPSNGSGRLSAGQAAEAKGVLVLCPDHPQAAAIQASIDAAGAAAAAASALTQAVADGTYVDSGKYLIGTDIQPGTWQSVGEKVTDCYWEISDSQGEIIDNNFISIAPQFTIQIPGDAAGFTASGCSFQRIGD